MRSVLHNLLVVAIALTLFGAISRVLRQPQKIRPVIDLETGATFPVLDEATLNKPGKWRLKLEKVHIPPSPWLVPPPPNHESSRWVKTAS